MNTAGIVLLLLCGQINPVRAVPVAKDDAVYAALVEYQDELLVVYKHPDNHDLYAFTFDGMDPSPQIRVTDLNADGRPDIAVPGKTGTWVLFNEGVR